MGKYDSDDGTSEKFYIKHGSEWVPIDLKMGGARSKTASKKSESVEEFFIQKDGRWVKVSGVSSADEILDQLKSLSVQQRPSRVVHHQIVAPQPVVMPQPAAPVQIITSPQQPQEYREYIISVVQPPPAPQPVEQPAVEYPPPRRPGPRPSLSRRAVPNEYAEGPIQPQRIPVYRSLPPRQRMGPPRRAPSPRMGSPMRPPPMEYMPPMPPMPSMPPMPPRERINAYEMGRAAYLAETDGVEYVQESYSSRGESVLPGGVRTAPAPGYYLAGYLYFGDPNQPKPVLQPLGQTVQIQQAPPPAPVQYVTGYAEQQSYDDQPAAVEYDYEEEYVEEGPRVGWEPGHWEYVPADEVEYFEQGYPEFVEYQGNPGYLG